MFDIAGAAVEGALAAGARYADARVMFMRTESVAVRNGVVERLVQNESAGVGVRALIGSSWGFHATRELADAAARRAGEQAAAIAKASASVPGPALELASSDPVEAHWESTWEVHPLDGVTLAEKTDLLVGVTSTINAAGVPIADAGHSVWDTEKWFASSEGHRISQRIVECGALMSATAIGDGETQRR
ncbi:MAG TPA: DNA gyrase modulator, partial [Acidimicrobiales bacterium]